MYVIHLKFREYCKNNRYVLDKLVNYYQRQMRPKYKFYFL